LYPHAAGIDVGASELFVAVSADRDPLPVRSFPTFTRYLNALVDWLQQYRIHSVAMQSTSVYRIPVYQILESRGLEVCLVNAQHIKNVPGKTDVSDCSGFSPFILWVGFVPVSVLLASSALCALSGDTAAA
jgi:transposase